MKKYGLVLGGGGMRCLFTVGVLDYFLEKGLEFNEIIGVSAGACHATSFISKQSGRAKKISLDYLGDKNYFGISSFLRTGNYFNVDFIYNKVPNELNIFDYETFNNSKTKLITCVTNIKTGKPEYLKVNDLKKDINYITASASLPFLSKTVVINDNEYLDGGLSDTLPVKEMKNHNIDKIVVVLTRDEKYQKKKRKWGLLLKLKYKKYPNLIRNMNNRASEYNEDLKYIMEEEEKGNIFVIRPNYPYKVKRLEKNKEVLEFAYKCGYEKAKYLYEDLVKYLER